MIYIQSNTDRTLPHHFDCACAMYGAIENVTDYRLTTFEEVSTGKFDMVLRNHLFIGSVEFMREVFNRIGLSDIRLPLNSNRQSERITLGDAYERVAAGEVLFIKPIEIKLFTGLVLDRMVYGCLSNLSRSVEVLAYDAFPYAIETEWRIYVYRNEMYDARNYSGDFTLLPDFEYVRKIIETNKTSFPNTYTIDVGMLANGECVVIEYNDMWAIGNYGVQNRDYIKMLHERYFDIIRNQSNVK